LPSSVLPTYYPIFLAIQEKRCLVVGGGEVAAGKIRGLLEAGAKVIVVSPRLNTGLQRLSDERRIAHRTGEYTAVDLDGVDLVFCATDDGSVNARVAADCRRRGIWVNAADDPPNCDFILPSVIRKGRVTLAASTSGGSPALARRLREELEVFLSEDIAALADLLAEVRAALQGRQINISPARWQQAIDSRLRALLAQSRTLEARAYLLETLGVDPDVCAPVDGSKGAEMADERS